MRIGILTLPLHGNYGGNLQAYALMQVLRDMGHEPHLIARTRKRAPLRKRVTELAKRAIKKYVLRRPGIHLTVGLVDSAEQRRLEKHSLRFIAGKIQPQTRKFSSRRELERHIQEYRFDAVVVGSDQVWRPRYAPDIRENFLCFLREGDCVKRIAYAASFGTTAWEYSQEQAAACADLIRKFDAVSVRESSGVDLCKAQFGVEAEHVVDPTMLLEADHYRQLADKQPRHSQPRFALVYLLDEDPARSSVVKAVGDTLGLTPHRVNSIGDDGSAAPVEAWVAGFRDAEFVITDSFHACVFAILFQKPFLAYGNASRGLSRFESLLDMFGLSARLISTPNQATDALLTSPIDWALIESILEKQRKKARAFLESALCAQNALALKDDHCD